MNLYESLKNAVSDEVVHKLLWLICCPTINSLSCEHQRILGGAFFRYPFSVTDSKISLKALSALNHANFEGGARLKKMQFFGQHFPKSA